MYPKTLIIGTGNEKIYKLLKTIDKSHITYNNLPMSSLTDTKQYETFIQDKLNTITFNQRTIGDMGDYNIDYFDYILTKLPEWLIVKILYIFNDNDKENMQKMLTLSQNHSNMCIINENLLRKGKVLNSIKELVGV